MQAAPHRIEYRRISSGSERFVFIRPFEVLLSRLTGLLTSSVDLMPVGMIPWFDALVEVRTAPFGRLNQHPSRVYTSIYVNTICSKKSLVGHSRFLTSPEPPSQYDPSISFTRLIRRALLCSSIPTLSLLLHSLYWDAP